MTRLHIAPDAEGEPTVWNGEHALLRRCEVDDLLLWGLVVAGVDNFDAARDAERLEQDAVRTIGLFLDVVGGRVEIPDNVVEALDRDAVVVRWRDEAKAVEVWELRKPGEEPT